MGIAKAFLFIFVSFLPLQGEEATFLREDPSSFEEELVYPKPEGSPPQISQDFYQKNFIKTLGLLVFAIATAISAGYLLKNFSHKRPFFQNQRNNIKILERRPLSPSTQLYLVQIGNQHFVLAESKLEVRKVATLETTNLADQGKAPS